jgi:hypothetical protein
MSEAENKELVLSPNHPDVLRSFRRCGHADSPVGPSARQGPIRRHPQEKFVAASPPLHWERVGDFGKCGDPRLRHSIRYYSKPGLDRLIRIDYHGAKEVPSGTCQAILKAAGLGRKEA